jgi:soluble cytochrome b562
MRNKLMLMFFFAIIVCGGIISAQSDRHLLDEALQRTDDIIERAIEIVQRSNSDRAKSLLDNAINLQKRAQSLSQESGVFDDLARAVQAGRYTKTARETAQRAITIARQEAQNEDYIRRRLERSSEIIHRAEEKIGMDAPDNVSLLLATAREKQHRAVELFRNRRYKMSLQLTMQVEKSLKNMFEEAGGYIKAKQRYESLQERYYTLLDRIESSEYGDESRNRQHLNRAEKIRKDAEAMAAQLAFQRAEAGMQNAVKILLTVSEEIKEPEKIRQALNSLSRQIEVYKVRIEESGDRNLQKMYRNASGHLDKAARHFQEGNYDAAATQLQAVRQLMNQIRKRVENKG